MRLYAVVLGAPDEAVRDRDIARLLDWGFDRFSRRRSCAPARSFGRAGARARGRGAGESVAQATIPGEQVRERVVLPRRLNRTVRAGQRSATSSCGARGGVLGACRSSPTATGGGQPGARALAALHCRV